MARALPQEREDEEAAREDRARGRGEPEEPLGLPAEEQVEGHGEQPELDRHEHETQHERGREHRPRPRGILGPAHDSTPTAYTTPPSRSIRMRASGRRGGPATGTPLRTSKAPSWHGQKKRCSRSW